MILTEQNWSLTTHPAHHPPHINEEGENKCPWCFSLELKPELGPAGEKRCSQIEFFSSLKIYRCIRRSFRVQLEPQSTLLMQWIDPCRSALCVNGDKHLSRELLAYFLHLLNRKFHFISGPRRNTTVLALVIYGAFSQFRLHRVWRESKPIWVLVQYICRCVTWNDGLFIQFQPTTTWSVNFRVFTLYLNYSPLHPLDLSSVCVVLPAATSLEQL